MHKTPIFSIFNQYFLLSHDLSYANIWSSGKISIYGATSEDNCLKGARRIARYLQKLGLAVRMSCFEIVNCLGSCKLEFGIFLDEFANDNKGPCV